MSIGFCDAVRAHCRAVMDTAVHVRIDDDALAAIAPGDPPRLDPADHFTEGEPAAVAHYILALDAVNFGSGWFDGLSSFGYETIARSLAGHFRATAPADPGLAGIDVPALFCLPPQHELCRLFAEALCELEAFLARRGGALAVVEAADHSAEQLAASLAEGLPMWRDTGFYKRAQIAASDLALAGVARFFDLRRLTIFADNLVPHVLRIDGALVVDDASAARLDRGELLTHGEALEVELRAAAVVAGERLAGRLGVTERDLDGMLWQRGQDERYGTPPPHRCRTTFY